MRFYSPRTAGDVLKAASECRAGGIGCLVLGGGSNLLVDDEGPDAAVLSSRGFDRLEVDGERIRAGAGVSLGMIVRRAAALGLSGIEGLAGIPGSAGGAVAMNAGGAGGSMCDVVESVEFIDSDLRARSAPAAEMQFGYRSVRRDAFFVTHATLRLARSTPAAVRAATRSTVERKRSTQPVGAKSAGCMFRNPGRISAGFLIDKAGLKGFSVGDAEVSPVHANFIVNRGCATSADILALAHFVRSTVKSVFGIELDMEVKIWSRSAEGRYAEFKALERRNGSPALPEAVSPEARR